MKKLTHLLKKYWFLALLASGFMVAEVYVDLYQPRMMQLIVDEGILGLSSNGVSNLNLVISTGIRMLLIVLLGGLCGIGSALFTNITGQSYGNDIRKACFEKVMRFSFEQTDDFSTGSLITRITNDVTQLQQLVMQLIRGLVRCLMFFVGGTAALLSLDLSFGVIAACAFPLILIDIVFVVWRTNPLFTVLQESLDKLNGIIQENVAGIRVVKAFVQEKREKERFDEANRHLVDTQFNVQMMLSFLRPVMNIVLNIAVVGILYVGSVQVRQGTVGPGMVMAAITYISQILNGMMMLAMIFQTLSRGLASARRLGEVLDTESDIVRDPALDACSSGTRGSVTFENISFAYTQSEKPVLRGVSLEIAPGETLAVIGATGCGKTTLVNLIPRFYDVTEGRVLVDGAEISAYNKRTLTGYRRTEVGFVFQFYNLIPNLTALENVEIAAKLSKNALDSAAVLEQVGLAERAGNFPAQLSGGEQQRVAIARALAKKPKLLLCDEPTGALDYNTGKAILKLLQDTSRAQNMTVIIITHNKALCGMADRVIRVKSGTIQSVTVNETVTPVEEIEW